MNNKRNLTIKTGVNPSYVKNVVTQDINCFECILDLIDNSIDAAKSLVIHNLDDQGMPLSYEGVKISLEVSSDGITLHDNCSGISKNAIEERLLVIGEESNQKLAIGHFGVGLKRALLKLGNEYSIETCTGGDKYEMSFNANSIAGNTEKPLQARFLGDKNPSTYTTIRIKEPTNSYVREIVNDDAWEKKLRDEFSIRYSIFIKKGLSIQLNESTITPTCPDIKHNPPVLIQQATLQAAEGIQVHIRAGMHEDYYKTGDPEYNSKNIESITDQYGWYYVCNDRVIKIATRDKKFGWGPRWHNEYYGFVGWVYFVGDVAKLPWNTKKTDIDPTSEAFEAIKPSLQQYANTYRSQNRTLKKQKTPVEPKPEEQVDGEAEKPVQLGRPDHQNSVEDGPNNASTGVATPNLNRNFPTRIPMSDGIVTRLNELGSHKLSQLYNSLCRVSLIEHPSLMDVGAWAFFESLSRLIFNKAGNSFVANFNNKMNQDWYKNDPQKRKLAIRTSLETISSEGNCVKHDSMYVKPDAQRLAMHFKILEPLIIKALDEAIEKRKTGFVPEELT